MIKLTRTLALILTAAVILSLTACTSEKTEPGGSSSNDRIPATLTFRDADGAIIADNADVKSAKAQKGGSEYSVLIKFTDEGSEKFADATARLIGQPLSIYLDDEELMSPVVQVAITNGEVVIVGEKVSTKEKAEEIADAIMNGWMPSAIASSSGQTGTKPTEKPAQASKPLNYQFTEILPPTYDEIQQFYDEMSAVRIGDKWGFIDESGAEVIPVQYDFAFHFSEGFGIVASGIGEAYKAFYVDKAGNPALTLNGVFPNGSFSEGLASVYVRAEDGLSMKFGFIDKSGSVVIPCEYDGVTTFDEGLAIISVLDESGIRYKFGVIDKNGANVVEPKYTKIEAFTNGMAHTTAIGSTPYYGFIDKSGTEIAPTIYEYASQFNADGYAVVKRDGRYGIIDTNGNEVVQPQYDVIYTGFSEGLAAVEQDGKVGFVNESGNVAIPFIYDTMRNQSLCRFWQGLALVSQNGKYGFIDKLGKEVIPFQYDDITGGFSKTTGLACVGLGGNYGFIDQSGKEVIPVKYGKGTDLYSTSSISFTDGLAAVVSGGKFGLIDTEGKEVSEFKWGAIDQYTGADGIIFVANGDSYGKKWGLLKYTTSN
jgi:hypothetical protein